MTAVPQTSVPTSQNLGIPGQLADFQSAADAIVDMAMNAEASADLPFGLFVIEGTGDDDAKLPTGQSDTLKGVVVHGHSFERLTELASDGIKPGVAFGCLKRGRVWILPTTDMTSASHVHVQVIANTGHAVGTIRATADTGKTLDITAFAKVLVGATVASGNPVKLDIDMNNVSLATAD